MRRGISPLDNLLLTVGCISLFLWTLAGARRAPQCERGLCELPTSDTGGRAAPDGQPLPVPRFNIGLVNGKPGDLADLKPGAVLSRTELRGADWRGVDLRGVTLRTRGRRGRSCRSEAEGRGKVPELG